MEVDELTGSHAYVPFESFPTSEPASLDELFHDVPPIQSVDDLAFEGVFDSDEELDEFLAFIYAARHASVA